MRFLAPILCSVLALSSAAQAADYMIDPDHSTVGFKVKHLMISSVAGRFVDFKGSFKFDPGNVGASHAQASINASSIDTHQAKRDEHLRNPDFFDVAKFPSMSFVSKSVSAKSAETFQVLGDLTIRGVTKPVTLDVSYGGAIKDLYGKERAAFAATAKINRKDFGLVWNKLLETGGVAVGDEVTIDIEVEGIKG